MGSQNWWFGDQKNPAKNTSKSLFFLQGPVILRVTNLLTIDPNFLRHRSDFKPTLDTKFGKYLWGRSPCVPVIQGKKT